MLFIVNQLKKMVYFKSILTILDIKQLAKVLIEIVIKYHSLPNSIMTDQGSLFILKFWSFLCYYFNIKCQLSTTFY